MKRYLAFFAGIILGLSCLSVFISVSFAQSTTTRLSFAIFLHGIGKGGDNANPTGTGNTSPRTPTRSVLVQVLNASNQLVTTATGNVTYNATNGNFAGTIDVPSVASGVYTVRVKTDKYLGKTVPGIQQITAGQTKQIPSFALIAGDTSGDNMLNILDYNMLLDCFSDISPAKNCNPTKQQMTDLTDDGKVNQLDYNLLLREFSVQTGDGGGTGTVPTQAPNPTGGVSVSGAPDPGNTGLGVGSGDGLEVGVNMAAFNKVKADAVAGVYDRPCTAAEHNRMVWHTLVDPVKKCHYDHQHGDDPNYVNDIFGQPGAWFDKPGQSISYPWQTYPFTKSNDPAPADINLMENYAKHEGYIWIVRRNQPADNDGYNVKDFRTLIHFHASIDAPTRFHSFSTEIRLCKDVNDVSTCGIYRTGGWLDHGHLLNPTLSTDCWSFRQDLGYDKLNTKGHIPLTVDNIPQPYHDDPPIDELRCHKMLTAAEVSAGPKYTGDKGPAEWWAHGSSDYRFQMVMFDPIGNVYGPHDGAQSGVPLNGTTLSLYCPNKNTPGCKWNASVFTLRQQYIVGINSYYPGGYETNGGLGVNMPRFQKYLTRMGGLNSSCSRNAIGVDCIPLEMSNLQLPCRLGTCLSGYTHSACNNERGQCPRTDYDITPAGKASWISWYYRYFP